MSRTQLLESLAAVGDVGAITFDDGRYIDWSAGTLEIGDADGEALNIAMSRDDLERLHAALTRTLLQSR